VARRKPQRALGLAQFKSLRRQIRIAAWNKQYRMTKRLVRREVAVSTVTLSRVAWAIMGHHYRLTGHAKTAYTKAYAGI
jgi:hypothetical protein